MSQGPAINRTTGAVTDTSQSYIDGDVKPLSLSTEGHLRVMVVPAPVYMEFFRIPDRFFNTPQETEGGSPWEQHNPWFF